MGALDIAKGGGGCIHKLGVKELEVSISTMAKEEVGKGRKAEGRDRGRFGCN